MAAKNAVVMWSFFGSLRLKAFDLEAFKFPTFSIKQLGLMSRTRLSTEDPTIVGLSNFRTLSKVGLERLDKSCQFDFSLVERNSNPNSNSAL